jgi:hypothetical protein
MHLFSSVSNICDMHLCLIVLLDKNLLQLSVYNMDLQSICLDVHHEGIIYPEII